MFFREFYNTVPKNLYVGVSIRDGTYIKVYIIPLNFVVCHKLIPTASKQQKKKNGVMFFHSKPVFSGQVIL